MFWSRRSLGAGPLGIRLEGLFLAGMVALAGVKWLVDSWRLQLIARAAGVRISRLRSFQIYMASVFGANVTPFFAGGLATQIYFLSLLTASPGLSVAVGAIYGILNLVVNLLLAVVVLVWPPAMLTGLRRFAFVGLVGMIALTSTVLMALIRNHEGAERLVRRWLRRRPAAAESAVRLLHDFSEGLRTSLQGRPGSLIGLVGVSLASQLLSLLFTPLAVGALGVHGISVWQIVLTQVGVQFSASVGATPGGTGIIEGVFGLFFQPLVGARTGALTLLWRSATFWLPTVVGAGMFVWLLQGHRISKTPAVPEPES